MAEAKGQFWNRSTFLVITGASQGIGKNLAIEFSRLLAPESTILLLARTLPKLENTKKEILEINPTLNIKVCFQFFHQFYFVFVAIIHILFCRCCLLIWVNQTSTNMKRFSPRLLPEKNSNVTFWSTTRLLYRATHLLQRWMIWTPGMS